MIKNDYDAIIKYDPNTNMCLCVEGKKGNEHLNIKKTDSLRAASLNMDDVIKYIGDKGIKVLDNFDPKTFDVFKSKINLLVMAINANQTVTEKVKEKAVNNLLEAAVSQNISTKDKIHPISEVDEKTMAEKKGDSLFTFSATKKNQYTIADKKVGESTCCFLAGAFIASSDDKISGAMIDKILSTVKEKEVEKSNILQGNLAVDTDKAMDFFQSNQLKGYSLKPYTPKKGEFSHCGVNFDNFVQYIARGKGLETAFLEFRKSEAKKALLILNGMSIGMRKNPNNEMIEFFDSHGAEGYFHEARDSSAYVVSCKSPESALAYLRKRYPDLNAIAGPGYDTALANEASGTVTLHLFI